MQPNTYTDYVRVLSIRFNCNVLTAVDLFIILNCYPHSVSFTRKELFIRRVDVAHVWSCVQSTHAIIMDIIEGCKSFTTLRGHFLCWTRRSWPD